MEQLPKNTETKTKSHMDLITSILALIAVITPFFEKSESAKDKRKQQEYKVCLERIHVVMPNETMCGIADEYKMTLNELKALNKHIKNYNLIYSYDTKLFIIDRRKGKCLCKPSQYNQLQHNYSY